MKGNWTGRKISFANAAKCTVWKRSINGVSSNVLSHQRCLTVLYTPLILVFRSSLVRFKRNSIRHRCFLLKLAKFLRTPILRSIWERLTLQYSEWICQSSEILSMINLVMNLYEILKSFSVSGNCRLTATALLFVW